MSTHVTNHDIVREMLGSAMRRLEAIKRDAAGMINQGTGTGDTSELVHVLPKLAAAELRVSVLRGLDPQADGSVLPGLSGPRLKRALVWAEGRNSSDPWTRALAESRHEAAVSIMFDLDDGNTNSIVPGLAKEAVTVTS